MLVITTLYSLRVIGQSVGRMVEGSLDPVVDVITLEVALLVVVSTQYCLPPQQRHLGGHYKRYRVQSCRPIYDYLTLLLMLMCSCVQFVANHISVKIDITLVITLQNEDWNWVSKFTVCKCKHLSIIIQFGFLYCGQYYNNDKNCRTT